MNSKVELIHITREWVTAGETMKQVKSRRKREGLVYRHLENASRDLFDEHPELIRSFVGRNAGVYALYKKNKLYYVGLATGLRGRLKAHAKNRHSESWDRFSIYLTVKDQHLREIEALLLRIANPQGNKQRGKLAESKDIRRAIEKGIKEKQRSQMSSLFGRTTTPVSSDDDSSSVGDPELRKLFPQGASVRGTNKGKVFRARIQRNGKVRFGGKLYTSLSTASAAALKRTSNGWWFWQIERGRNNWVRLQEIRKSRTPIYVK